MTTHVPPGSAPIRQLPWRARPGSDELTAERAGWLSAQAGVLAVLSMVVGIGPAGIVAAAVYAVTLWILLERSLRRAGTSLGPADRVTLTRAVLVGGVIALVADFATGAGTPAAVGPMVGLAIAGFVLDGVDGRVARRTGTASWRGARFDLEIDALLILTLSVRAADVLGPWVLAIGLMRYAFGAAGWLLAWLRRTLPSRFSAKFVAVQQGVTLVVVVAEILPRPVEIAGMAVALAALLWSFGYDVVRLWHRRDDASPLQFSGPVPDRRG